MSMTFAENFKIVSCSHLTVLKEGVFSSLLYILITYCHPIRTTNRVKVSANMSCWVSAAHAYAKTFCIPKYFCASCPFSILFLGHYVHCGNILSMLRSNEKKLLILEFFIMEMSICGIRKT